MKWKKEQAAGMSSPKEHVCSNKTIKDLKLGTMAGDMEVVALLQTVFFADGGPDYPTGVFFTPSGGGLPAPSPESAAALMKLVTDFGNELKKKPLDLCMQEGQKASSDAFNKAYLQDDGPMTDYNNKNCKQIIKALESPKCKLLVNGFKASLAQLP